MNSKILLTVVAVGALASVSGSGCAHDEQAQQSQHETYLTGSYLPQNVSRSGPVTNGKDDVRVIDRSEINRSGGADVQQSLRQLGATH